MAHVPTPEELITAANDRTLAEQMSRRFGLTEAVDADAATARCAALHQDGRLDLLALVEAGDIPGLDGPRFFMASHFLCGALVGIDAPVARMMRVIDALVTRGGGDLMASQPNGTFRSWCERDAARPQGVIRAAGAGDALALKFLSFALEASNAVAAARSLARIGGPEERMSAVIALGRMPHPNPQDLQDTLAVFHDVATTDPADNERAYALQALASLLDAANIPMGPDAEATLKMLLTAPGEYTLHVAASLLWRHLQIMTPSTIAVVLGALAEVNPDNQGTINDLDLALEKLLTSGHGDQAIAFLTGLLAKPGQPLALDAFKTFVHALVAGPPAMLSRAVTVWLIDGSRQLCEGLSSALGRGERDQPITLLAADLARPPAELSLLCDRAVGFLFVQPTAAASILISVLRVCPPEMAQGVEDLLVETLLLNYGGLRDYLESLDAKDVAKAHAVSALARDEAHLVALRAIPDIPELRPSEHHKEIAG